MAPPVSATTMVLGLALATAATSASWLPTISRLASEPSLLWRVTKTIATSDCAASAAAEARIAPGIERDLRLRQFVLQGVERRRWQIGVIVDHDRAADRRHVG